MARRISPARAAATVGGGYLAVKSRPRIKGFVAESGKAGKLDISFHHATRNDMFTAFALGAGAAGGAVAHNKYHEHKGKIWSKDSHKKTS